jgi:hypothetical protein
MDMDYLIIEHGLSDAYIRISEYFKKHKWKEYKSA